MLRKRLTALVIDFCVTMVPYSMAVVIILLIQDNGNDYSSDKYMYILSLVLLVMSEIIFFSKDVFFKKSIGKRIVNIKIVTVDGEEPKAIQLILRNITFFIWPLEIFLLLIDRQRIGDMLAKTRIVMS